MLYPFGQRLMLGRWAAIHHCSAARDHHQFERLCCTIRRCTRALLCHSVSQIHLRPATKCATLHLCSWRRGVRTMDFVCRKATAAERTTYEPMVLVLR